MNDEAPIALTAIAIGLGLIGFSARGILREVRSGPGVKADWGLVALAGGALLGGVAIALGGMVFLQIVFYSTDL